MAEQNQKALAVKDQVSQLESAEQEVMGVEIKAEFDVAKMVKSAGAIKLTDALKKQLFAPPPDEQVEIRPDGIVYLPHIFYSSRLREAFGWEFALIPKGDPKYIADKKLVVWGFYMIVKGSLMAYAIGHQEYHEGKHMTYIDAMEGAKSNAVMRLCKDLGIATQLWEPEWREDWKQRWAYKTYEGNKVVWKKKRAPNGEQAVKTEEYIEVEKAIKDIMSDPAYTGVVELVDKETGEITRHDLEVERQEIMGRLNSPKVFGMNILNKILKRCLDEMKIIEAEAIHVDPESVQVEDPLGDSELEPEGDNDHFSLPHPEEGMKKSEELFDAEKFTEPDPNFGASSKQGDKVKLPPRGEKLPPRKNGKK